MATLTVLMTMLMTSHYYVHILPSVPIELMYLLFLQGSKNVWSWGTVKITEQSFSLQLILKCVERYQYSSRKFLNIKNLDRKQVLYFYDINIQRKSVRFKSYTTSIGDSVPKTGRYKLPTKSLFVFFIYSPKRFDISFLW